ncbi:MAG: hypothetical protein GKR91_05995 [Pseudomonadales bacterium]|nr:hypothetical protein [Pseudomonadales bacterium]
MAYKFHFLSHKILPRFCHHPDTIHWLATSKERDEEANLKSFPPDDETILAPAFWVIEFYTPSHIEGLLTSLIKLGWDSNSETSLTDPVSWISACRNGGSYGGWLNIGRISSVRSTMLHHRFAPLPYGVESGDAKLHMLTQSLFCLIIQFKTTKRSSGTYDYLLRKKHRTSALLRGKSTEFLEPENKRIADIKKSRQQLRDSATSWFREHLPGLFATSSLGKGMPICELVTFSKAIPFNDEHYFSSKMGYMHTLSMDYHTYSYANDDVSGFKFSWPIQRSSMANVENYALLTINEADFDDKKFVMYEPKPNELNLYVVNEVMEMFLTRWGCFLLTQFYEAQINKLDETLNSKYFVKKWPINKLRDMERYISSNADLTTILEELKQFASFKKRYSHEVESFSPCQNWDNSDSVVPVHESIRRGTKLRSKMLLKRYSALRESVAQVSALIAASTNTMIQWLITGLTILVLLISIYSVLSVGD